jgi:uncharacterized protein
MPGSYTIQLGGLKEGRHTVDLEINSEFFDQFEESEVKEGNLVANIELDKRASHIDIRVKIAGYVRIGCDRCLETFSQKISCENRLLIKFGKSAENRDPDIINIPAEENELDLKQHIYEYILLALPIKRVHPDDKDGKSTCDPVMLEKLNEFITGEEPENDPRWEMLKKLMNDNINNN